MMVLFRTLLFGYIHYIYIYIYIYVCLIFHFEIPLMLVSTHTTVEWSNSNTTKAVRNF
ncbi:hypothetical protein K6L59_02900 [Candidatus Phytoplasma sp. Tabriz.2]|nr:hypothetical protein [Candidatus Phytoplasma australiense]